MRPSRRERLSIWTSSRKSACKRAGWITGAGPYWKAIRGSNMTLFAPRVGRIVRSMRGPVLIAGAGAIGSVVGGLLAATGSTVTLLGQRDHMDAVQARGLAIDGLFGTHRVSGLECATAAGELGGPYRAIFLTVKAYDAAEMVDTVAPFLDRDGVLVCMQNGLGTLEPAIAEAFAVARAAGIALRWPDAGAYRAEFYGRLVPATARHRSSMLQDLARGRPTEIEAINGYVAARGAALGVPAPTNATLTRLIRARARSRSWKP